MEKETNKSGLSSCLVQSQSSEKLQTYVIAAHERVPFTSKSITSPLFEHGSFRDKINFRTAQSYLKGKNLLVTETIYGFLEFTTTVGSTVMVFTPQSDKDTIGNPKSLRNLPDKTIDSTAVLEKPTVTKTSPSYFPKSLSSKRVPTGLAALLQQALLPRNKDEEKRLGFTKEAVLHASLYHPEEIVVGSPQTNPPVFLSTASRGLASSVTSLKTQNNRQPIGLVTTLGGTIISDGQKTIYKTSVVGTFLGNQYAQILKSTSKIIRPSTFHDFILPDSYKTVEAFDERSSKKALETGNTKIPEVENIPYTVTRSPRYETKYPKLTRRTGEHTLQVNDYHDYPTEYEENQTSDSLLRPSFELNSISRSANPSRSFANKEVNTLYLRQKSAPTRNIPPLFLRNSLIPKKQNKNANKALSSPYNPNLQKNPHSWDEDEMQPSLIQTPTINVKRHTEETIRVVSSIPIDGPSDTWYEIATLRSLHTFVTGDIKNSRHITYTKTYTHSIKETENPSGSPKLSTDNTLNTAAIVTLPLIRLHDGSNNFLKTTTDVYQTAETVYKTSILPVKMVEGIEYHTLTQTYHITRIVSALRTVPIVATLEGNSENKLLAEGTEITELLTGEREYDDNLEEIEGSSFTDNTNPSELINPEIQEKKTLDKSSFTEKRKGSANQEILATFNEQNFPLSNAAATPSLSQESLQLAYLRFMNPFIFGGLSGTTPLQQTTLTTIPIVVTTHVTTTDTRVLRVIFNARPIFTTISSTEVVRTTMTTYTTSVIPVQPLLSGLGRLPFVVPQFPFQAG